VAGGKIRVAESGGFIAAARRLNVSTTTVSEECPGAKKALDVRR
jgi:hypothetical protein